MDAYKAVNANVATLEGQKYDSVIAQEFSSRYHARGERLQRGSKRHRANAADPAGKQERIGAADDGGSGNRERYLPAAEAGESCVYSSAKAGLLGASEPYAEPRKRRQQIKNPGHGWSREILLSCCCDLPVSKRDFIQPGGKSSLLVVSIHLEGDVDFTHVVGTRRISPIHVMRYAIVSE